MFNPNAERAQEVDLNIVGGNSFGRYPKISDEQTWNMFQSDDALVPFPGYKVAASTSSAGVGRAVYSSVRGNIVIAVIGNTVYRGSGPYDFFSFSPISNIETISGDVFIDENAAGQIAICDKKDVWIYNWVTLDFQKALLPDDPSSGLPILPGYVTYHDSYFIVPDTRTNKWYLSEQNDGLNWNWGGSGQPVNGAILTKPTNAVAVVRAPGGGNLVYVFGNTVTELWYNNGGQLFPYQRSNSVSIDYGCLSADTIACMDNMVCWLGVNEAAGPEIMFTTGTDSTRISTDGIDLKLAGLKNPAHSAGFFFKETGHLIYVITFFDPEDNFTLFYDFNAQKFYYASDEHMDYFIAKSVCYFNNTHYFVSDIDSNIYELNSKYTFYDYTPVGIQSNTSIINPLYNKIIPRIRICDNIRNKQTSRFLANSLTMTIQEGNDTYFQMVKPYYITTEDGLVITVEAPEGQVGDFISTEGVFQSDVPRIDLSISRDGGENFGSYIQYPLNPLGIRAGRVIFYRLGSANDMVCQFRFWSYSRIVVFNGVMQIRGV